jgi:hypothetical protein
VDKYDDDDDDDDDAFCQTTSSWIRRSLSMGEEQERREQDVGPAPTIAAVPPHLPITRSRNGTPVHLGEMDRRIADAVKSPRTNGRKSWRSPERLSPKANQIPVLLQEHNEQWKHEKGTETDQEQTDLKIK